MGYVPGVEDIQCKAYPVLPAPKVRDSRRLTYGQRRDNELKRCTLINEEDRSERLNVLWYITFRRTTLRKVVLQQLGNA
jgi:hypothetical protein